MRIIVLVDFSLYTECLIKVATNWADLLDAVLVLVHEVPRMVPAMADDDTRYNIIDYEKEEAISMLKTLAERNIPEHISTKYEVTDRRLTYFLPHLMSDKEQTVIMLGLKGTGLLKKVFIGSVATQIISKLNKITVGVPLKANKATPENLIVPANPDYPINDEKLDQLVNFLCPTLKSIDFISIDRSEDKNLSTNYLKELSNKYNGRIPTSYKVFKSQQVFEEFKSYTTTKEHSFLVLQKGGDSFKDMVLKRFFINRIVHDGTIPLIVLPE
ncbi:universal stress protein [Aliifodinibius sp. S!AR15-10]|uniref:universal stress protein n=1 Tax=Aliifodinibius sp. S!AR15-10 TaxID=2950437 RepID=UPI00285CD14B|nr:universal stress protein [Aliifodinibius sp. S!AR15-10]MDR8390030.1 universal stress protein [Aliifodinibius sp. S!AR15-10]